MNSFRLLGRVSLGLTIAVGSLTLLFAREPIFTGLGPYTRKITTHSRQAQRYFNQGLDFYHGFSHGAAIRAFKEAVRSDPKCAMAHWGIALANGPHINFPMVPRQQRKRPGRNYSWPSKTRRRHHRSRKR